MSSAFSLLTIHTTYIHVDPSGSLSHCCTLQNIALFGNLSHCWLAVCGTFPHWGSHCSPAVFHTAVYSNLTASTRTFGRHHGVDSQTTTPATRLHMPCWHSIVACTMLHSWHPITASHTLPFGILLWPFTILADISHVVE
jgi:hypothetical protein